MEMNELQDKIRLNADKLSAEQLNVLLPRLNIPQNWVSAADEYIVKQELDAEIFSPLWGENTMRLIAGAIFNGNVPLIESLRLLWWFSGWPIIAYTDKNTFPVFDPVYVRYQKLKAVTPDRFRYAAPAILGEAGWKEGDDIVNHDVAILQERIQFLYFSGVAAFLDKAKEGTILELGSGYGGMSLAFNQCFPEYRNVLCDVPQCLAVAYCYLNAAKPDADHYAITVDGITHVNTGNKVSPEEAFNSRGSFIYLPNYLMPEYESYLAPSLAYNAMSLHEMPDNTIKYYCSLLPKLLKKREGIFCEVNTLVGLPNVRIDQELANSFDHCLDLDYPSLACRPRLWTDSDETFSKLTVHYQATNKNYSLFDLFEFDASQEFPVISDAALKEMLLDKLGKVVLPLGSSDKSALQIDGYAVPLFVVPPGDEPFMGNHLRHIVGRRFPYRSVELQQRVNELTRKVNKLEAEAAQYKQDLNCIHTSRSWRYTSVLRKATGKLRVLK